MSIREVIEAKVAEGQLFLLCPMMPSEPHSRLIYAGPMLQAELKESWDIGEAADRVGRLRADFDLFSTGGMITVSTGDEPSAFMKKLSPLADAVWEIRSRDPKPNIRVFGQFAATDVFIATHMCTRSYLGASGSKEWRDEFERCKPEWNKLFAGYRPVSGGSLNEYISQNVVDIGQFK
jgi:hypothetical protein